MPADLGEPRQFAVLDLAATVCCEIPAAGAAIDQLLDRFRTRRPGRASARCCYEIRVDENGDCTLRCDGAPLARGTTGEEVTVALLTDLNARAIETFDGFAVHAGAVARAGQVVAFPGISGLGKSTFTAACCAAGFAYVSDEALCIRSDTEDVVAYPKPIALSAHGWQMVGSPPGIQHGLDDGEKVMLSADQIGAIVADDALHLGHVVTLVRADGAPRLVAEPRTHALALLLRMAFNHYKAPAAAFDLVSRLAANARSWRLEYSDPRAAAELLSRELTF